MAIKCLDRDWRVDISSLPSVQLVDFSGPNLTDADFAEAEDIALEVAIQGELEDAQRKGLSYVLFLHGNGAAVAGETTIGKLVRGEVLNLISWDVVWRAKCRIYRDDAVLAAIRPPLSDAERDQFDRLHSRVERRLGQN
jgi:hypothetical protein